MDEVLNLQPSEVREFLRQTAVLKRFNAELCSAVTGRSDSETTLASLEQSNLFLIALDNHHNWYRYHHMFADFLRTELSKEQETQILKKASAWFELHHLFGDAVECARATGDFEFTADTVERALINPVTWSSGHISMLEGWLKTLPGAALRSRPRLQIRASRALFLAGKLQQSADNLGQAKSAVLSTDSDLLCQIDIYQAAIEAMEGSILKAKELISRASSSINEAECHVRARYFDTVGLICEQAGELQDAEAAYLKASDAALSAGVLYLAMNALCEVALVRIAQGQLSKASWACQEALDLVKDKNKKQLPPAAGLAWAVWGEIMRQRGDVDTAEEYILKGIKLSRQGGIIDDLRHGLIFLFQLRISQNHRSAAQEALHQAELVLQGYGLPRLGSIAKAMQVRFDLKFGGHTDAIISAANSMSECVRDYEDLTRMRFKIAERLPNALEEINVLIDKARAGFRRLTLIEALILRTLLLHRSGCLATAAASLKEAISLAEHEQCSQVFIDEGPALQKIIMECHNRGEFSDTSFSKELLMPLSEKDQRNPGNIEAMVEELTEQEQRILELLAAGMSNQDIAGELVISLGTVKWHLHNIYSKLGVSSRTQATAKGNKLGLL